MKAHDQLLRAYGPDDVAAAIEDLAEHPGTPAWRAALARRLQTWRRQTMYAFRSSRAPRVVKAGRGPGTAAR